MAYPNVVVVVVVFLYRTNVSAYMKYLHAIRNWFRTWHQTLKKETTRQVEIFDGMVTRYFFHAKVLLFLSHSFSLSVSRCLSSNSTGNETKTSHVLIWLLPTFFDRNNTNRNVNIFGIWFLVSAKNITCHCQVLSVLLCMWVSCMYSGARLPKGSKITLHDSNVSGCMN